VALLVVLAAVGVGAAVYYVLRDSGSDGGGGGAPVHLVASNAYDPQGDGHEHDEEVANATDGNPATAWETEDYRGSVTFGNLKDGVGIVLDAQRPVRLGSLTVLSDTPGYVARIEAGTSSSGPFDPVSSSQTVGGRTTFSLSVDPARRYYLVWITRLAPGYARTHVNEVTTSG
jgi:putative peptidoglycan lipid II flippase